MTSARRRAMDFSVNLIQNTGTAQYIFVQNQRENEKEAKERVDFTDCNLVITTTGIHTVLDVPIVPSHLDHVNTAVKVHQAMVDSSHLS